MDTNREFVVSNVNESEQVLRERYQQLGYLFLKKALAEDKCAALLDSFLQVLDPYVFSQSEMPRSNGAAFAETDPIWDEVYPKIQSLEQFHCFFHDDAVEELMKVVAGADVFVYPMKMARISTPNKLGFETPPHQDGHSHRAGPTMAGIWVALHDVNQSLGRLKILPGSHKDGVRPVHASPGIGGVQCEIYDHETVWHVSDVEQGDVIIFNSATIHKAEANVTESSVRLSVDTRFCDFGAPVFSTNLEPHHGWRIDGLDWSAVYNAWRSGEYQYYWRDYPNLF